MFDIHSYLSIFLSPRADPRPGEEDDTISLGLKSGTTPQMINVQMHI